jgi:hypothetical protein
MTGVRMPPTSACSFNSKIHFVCNQAATTSFFTTIVDEYFQVHVWRG